MGLANLFSSRKQDDHRCIELIVTEQTVQSVLWEINDQQVQILATGEVLAYQDSKDLIIKADQALQGLGKEAQKVSQTVFALELSWIDQNGILPEHKQLLKKMTQELSLKAVGFIVISEALAQFLVEQQPQISTLLLQVENHKISLSLIEEGDLQKTESLVRSADAQSDILEGLARLKGSQTGESTLPAQITLTSFALPTADLYAINQTLINHDWQEDNLFYSSPIIKTLDITTSIRALINQSGKALAQAKNMTSTAAPTQPEPTPNKTSESYGKSFGIPIKPELPPEKDADPEPDQPESKPHQSSSKLGQWLLKHRLMIGLGFGGGLLALVLLGFVYLTTTTQAIVKITPHKTNLNQDVEITLDPKIKESDFKNLVLKASPTYVEVTADQTTDTTGVTLVGEKASGQVQIVNKTQSSKTFEAGTTLYYNEFRYTLNDDVTVASASVEEKTGEEVKTYGTATVNVTSVEIGADRNLDKETELKVADFADNTYKAVVGDEGLTGGSSRELRVVSEEDQTSLLASVKKEVLKDAEAKFQEQSDGDQQVIPTQSLEIVSQKYDAAVGDEAKTLSLTLTAKVEGIAYQKEDLKPLANQVLADLVPEGFELSDKDPQILSDIDQTASSSAITLQANINSEARAKVELDQLQQDIVGKSIDQAVQQLKNNSSIESVSIELQPEWVKAIWQRLPGNATRIKMELE